MPRATMTEISYGISRPVDLLDKLVSEGSKIENDPNSHNIFNFLVTAAVLNEWIIRYYQSSLDQGLRAALERKDIDGFPSETSSWISDKRCLPNKGCDVCRHVRNAMSICWDTANASKHYFWTRASGVSAIEKTPKIKDWYQYFFTSTEHGLYVEINGEYYTIKQINGILTQFYRGLLFYLESSEDAKRPEP